ncbi:MAG: bifunctional folylpolyglutamate synthase/dihydrofolate synthase [Clostridiales bacterium]|nr:bifunctional folylpolyglutamate synthase/dihydrofolate synthase [Clostridiales bacterium]
MTYNYNEAVKYLEGAALLGSKHGLSDLEGLLWLMGSPEKGLNIIHVAGTNGKGSFCAYTESILREAGYSVGVFTSPHLIKYNERFSLNGEDISNEDLAAEVFYVKNKVEEYFGGKNEWFSFFEIMTAVCFSYFSKKKPDFLILETGLGGRLDSTNTVKNPLYTAIMKIDLDHTEFLGNTIEEIAAEKGGIIKPNRPCVLYPHQPSAYPVIKQIAEEKNSRLFYSESIDLNILSSDYGGIVFDIETEYFKYKGLRSKMAGLYQPRNIAAVLTGVEILKSLGYDINKEAVYRGVEKAKIRGRMDIVSKDPLIILDGAHNMNAGTEFSAYLKSVGNRYGKITLVTGVLADKNPVTLIERLYENADRVILTMPPSKRAFNPNPAEISLNKETYYINEPKAALEKALSFNDGAVFVTGSLYLIGEVMNIINRGKGKLNDRLEKGNRKI